MAAFPFVGSAVGEFVAYQIASVATAMDAKFSGQSDTSAESENKRKAIEGKQSDWNEETLHESCEEAVDEDKPAEDSNEDGIVDDCRIASKCIRDDITDQRRDEENP